MFNLRKRKQENKSSNSRTEWKWRKLDKELDTVFKNGQRKICVKQF